jgi:hypothetical protein
MSSTNVAFRLRREAWTRYSMEAQQRGVALGTYLRQRLEEQDRMIAELSVRGAAAQNATQRDEPRDEPRNRTPPVELGTLVEVLFLLRTVAGPQKTAMVQKEVERRGLASWR